MKKKMISILLVALMLAMLLPTTALATESHNLTVTKNGASAAEGQDADYYWDDSILHILRSGLTVTGNTAEERIYVEASATDLTINNLNIVPTVWGGDNRTGISSRVESLKITILGNNQLGNAVTFVSAEATKQEEYFLDQGIACRSNDFSMYDVTFTGNGNLTIYDAMRGIEAEDITFDESFSGKLTVEDRGLGKACAIEAWGGNVELLGGTFALTSHISNGISAEEVTIKNCKVTVNGGPEGCGIECESLTVEGAGTEVVSHGATHGLKFGVFGGSITVKSGVIKLSGGEAALMSRDEVTVVLPEGLTMMGNTAENTFTNMQEATLKTDFRGDYYPYIGDTFAKSVMLGTPDNGGDGGDYYGNGLIIGGLIIGSLLSGGNDDTNTTNSNGTVTSADTADMGIALYGVLSISSLIGMGWVGKKRHE